MRFSYRDYIIQEVKTSDLIYYRVLNKNDELVFTRASLNGAKKIIDKYSKGKNNELRRSI